MLPSRFSLRQYHFLVLCLLIGSFLLWGHQRALASGSFIAAANRVDMVHDAQRDLLYITSGSTVLRYDLWSGTFLTPFQLSGSLRGIDISPDNNMLAVADTQRGTDTVWIYLVDLTNGTSRKATFPRAFGEGGTFSVAFGADGAVLVTSTYEGSGWVPMRRYDPTSNTFQQIRSVRQNSMLSASADGSTIAYEESNISSGPVGKYDVAQKMVTATAEDNWFNYEVAVKKNGAQFAVPTYGGTYIYDTNLKQIGLVGQYAGQQPIGVVYHPINNIVYFAFAQTSEVRAYDTNTLQQVAAYNFEYTFSHPGNFAFTQGRLKMSRDGSLLFATVGGGIRYVRLAGSPIAHNQQIAVTEDTPQGITLAGSVTEGIPATYTVLTPPKYGTLSGTSPRLSYLPAANYNGPDSFTFKISQNGIDSNTATITLDVRAVNDSPIAVADQASTQKGNAVTMAVLSNDSDVDGDALRVSSVSRPANGTVTINSDETITYTPNQTFSGKDTFTYIITDGHGGTATASVLVSVIDPAAPPVADNQQVTADEDVPQPITLTGSTSSGTAMSYVVLAEPAHGTLSGFMPNLVYEPAENYYGPDSFTFKIVQGSNESNIATVTIDVQAVNDAPVARNDQAATTAGAPITVSVLGNDSDIDDDALSVISVTRAGHGTTALDQVGTIRYTPDTQFVGTDSFRYTIIDGNGASATATVTVNVTTPTDRPVAYDQRISTDEDTAATITLNGSTSGDASVTYTLMTQPAHGTLSGDGPSVEYTPDADYYGPDTFTFKMSQGGVESNAATILIDVRTINDAPAAAGDYITTLKGQSVLITVLDNDTDLEADALTVGSVTRAEHGTITLNSDNSVLYTPNSLFAGSDSFSYVVSDGQGGSDVGTVQITVVDDHLASMVYIPVATNIFESAVLTSQSLP